MRILFAGGGSGGHIYPLLSVAQVLAKIGAEYSTPFRIDYLGPKDMYSSLLAKEGIRVHGMLAGKVRRYFSLLNILDVPKFFLGLIQAFMKLLFLMPDVVFSKGGTGAFPVVFAAWFYRIPVVIHESDASPGINNLLSARFARKICLTFESARKYFRADRTAVTGTPVREEYFTGDRNREFEKNSLGFREDNPLLFVTGGSQGSKRINETVISVLGELLKFTQVLHQTGIQNFEEAQKLSKAVLLETPLAAEIQNRYKMLPYLDTPQMKSALIASDLLISRSGSGNISDIATFGKASILIPHGRGGGGHQKDNAYALGEKGAAIVIEEDNLTSQNLLSQTKALIEKSDLRAQMGGQAAQFSHPNAGEEIAGYIIAAA